MRTALTVALGTFLLIGCSGAPSTGPTSETPKKAQELYEAVKRDMQTQLDQLDTQLAEWKQSVDKASGDSRAALEKRYNELKAERDKFAARVTEFGKATGSAWEKLKEGVVKSSADLADAFKKAAGEFK